MTKPGTPWQRGLQFFNGVMFVPNSVDGTGASLGGAWGVGTGTVTHATPGAAFDTQWKRTIWSNRAGAANDTLGPARLNAGDYQFWIGDEASATPTKGAANGGFYFSAIFRIETWSGAGSGTDGRLFVGLTASGTEQATLDTLSHNTTGLSHISTDGQDVLEWLTVDNTGAVTTKHMATHLLNPGLLASGVTFMWEMWAFPNAQSVINTQGKLSYFDTASSNNRVRTVKYDSAGGLTLNKFMAPQCQMSNGATDTTVNHYQMGVANIYCVPWMGEIE